MDDKWIDAIKKEITASMCIFIKGKEERVWNQALQKAIGIIKKYEEGKGLFQMTEGFDDPE